MKLVDYCNKVTQRQSFRQTIVFLAVETLLTGLFLGVAVIEGVERHNLWWWAFPLFLAISSGLGALQSMLIALHFTSTS